MAVDDAAVGTALPHFDVDAFSAAFDARRRDLGLGWYELADELWEQSADLNAQRMDHALCGGAVSRMQARGATSCQYGLFMLNLVRGDFGQSFYYQTPVLELYMNRLPNSLLLAQPG